MSDLRDMVHLPGLRGIKFSLDWIMRPLFGVGLAALVVAAILAGTDYFAAFVAVGVFFAAREWHRMVCDGSAIAERIVSVVFVFLAIGAFLLWPRGFFSWTVLGAGAAVVGLVALARGNNALWQAGGTLYVGVPALSLIALRALPPHGIWILIGLFVVVWATDTGALVTGNLLHGPKIAPVLSPNKTWAGTLGGMVAAGIAEAVYIGVIGGDVVPAFFFGCCIAVTAHAGDLFESWVKRHFSRKDSGTLIPGHGGVLDRADSTIAAATALAILVFAVGFNPLFGAHP
jgi:phosphatidate cytidylyltransferase